MNIELNYNGAAAKVDTYGAELFSYRGKDGAEYIWQGNPEYWGGRSPVLFPIVGGLKGNSINIDGHQYSMKRHGFGRISDYTVVQQTESSVTLRLTASEQTKQLYPYDFVLDITHTLSKDGFTTTYAVKNTDTRPIYFNVGGHTGFNCPVAKDEAFEDYSIVFDKAITANAVIGNYETGIPDPNVTVPVLKDSNEIKLSRKFFEIDTYMFIDIAAKSVALTNRKNGRTITMRYDDFPVLAIWSPMGKNAPFLCLEPWQGLPDFTTDTGKLEEKPYAVKLAVGESRSFSYTVTIN